MIIGTPPRYHLTYCTNIHPGESWSEVRENLEMYLPELKARLAPDRSFGVGLRLSNEAAEELLAGDRLSRFKLWLDEQDLYVYTINGFPYGSFHREIVKDRVYAPDWRKRERVEYTLRLARILAHLVPEDMEGGISTAPISYKRWIADEEMDHVLRTASEHLGEVAAALEAIRDETGRLIHIDIEPEPDCVLENTSETAAFFTDWLRPIAGEYLTDELGVSAERAAELVSDYIRVCYDTCHFAVEFEDPETVFDTFERAGIRVGKVQISSALKVRLPEDPDEWAALRERLRPFSEAVYLHQVIERREDGSLHRYPDLDGALIAAGNEKAHEWRIHYHVPIFVNQFDSLSSTRDDIVRALSVVRDRRACSHLEIETYTWDVLPDELKTDIVPSIQREYEWTLSQFDS